MSVPPRPGIVMRIPDREKARDSDDDFSLGSMGMGNREAQPKPIVLKQPNVNSAAFSFTLYTNVRKCKHSIEILEKIEKYGLVCDNVDVSKNGGQPKWITGTPIIQFEGNGYCGDLAFEFIDSLRDYIKNAQSESSSSNTVSKVGTENVKKTGTLFDRLNKDTDDVSSWSKAFKAPVANEEDDSRYNLSTEDMMKNISASMRR